MEIVPPELFCLIADHLSMVDLLTLTRVCTTLRLHSSAYVERLYNALLRTHLLEPLPLRRALDKSKGIIAGNAALGFLLREDATAPLAFFVPVTNHVGFINELERQGYEWAGVSLGGPNGRRDFHVHTAIRYTKGDTTVNVLVTSPQGALMALSKLPTTAHLTYINEMGVHTVLPSLTFKQRAVILRQNWQPARVRCGMGLPEKLTCGLGAEVRGMKSAGWDVKYGFKWDGAPCGDACGVVQQRFKAPTGFHLGFGKASTSVAIASYERTTEARDVRFTLRGQCRNPCCENYHQTA